MGALGWIVSIIGVVGTVGFIALVVVAPVLAGQLVKATLALLEAILSTRLGVGLLVGATCLLVGLLWGDHTGSTRVETQWAEARDEAGRHQARLDAHIAEKAAKTDETNTATEAAADKADKESRDAHKLDPRGECVPSDRDLEWLLRPRR